MPLEPDSSSRAGKHSGKEFNDEVKRAIDGAIYGILGKQVLASVYDHLKEHYGITSDEVHERLDSLFKTFEETFGVKGALTLSRVIARRVYVRMGLQFVEFPDYPLQGYLDQAKKQLGIPSEN